MAGKLTEKLHTVVDQDMKNLVVAAAQREDRSEGAIIRRALRVYFAANGQYLDEVAPEQEVTA